MNRFKKNIGYALLIAFVSFSAVYLAGTARSAGSTSIKGKALVLNTNNYLDFNASPYNSNVTISDPDPDNGNERTLSGYAWSADLGWVEFGSESTNQAVAVDYDTGVVSGKADVLNTGGVIDFNTDPYNSNVVIDTETGIFSGYAWSEEVGWINFGDTGVEVDDETAPTNPNSISGYDSSEQSTALTSGDWAKYETPYFIWTGAADQAGSAGYAQGVAGYYVYLGTDETADPKTAGSPQAAAEYTASNLSSGETYYLRIRAYDEEGNIADEIWNAFTYKYDGSEPENPAALFASNLYQSSVENFTVTWPDTGANAASDANSDVKGYQYRIGDTGTWYGSNHSGEEDCSDIITTSSYTLDEDFDSLATGENTFYLRTWDNACNVSTTYVTAILKYDATAPGAPQNLAVDPSTNTENSFAFSWEAPVTYRGEESSLEYCYTVNTVPSEANCTWTSSVSLTAGPYATQPDTNTFYVMAKDEAGYNYDSYTSINFTANTTAPSLPRSMDVSDISIKATSNWKLAVSWEAPESVGAGVETYKVYRSTTDADCSSDMSSFSFLGTTAGTSYTDTGLEQETYYYCTKACDSANKCSAVSSTVSGYPDGKYTTAASLTSGPSTGSITTKKATITWTTDRNSNSKIQYGTSSGSYFDEEVSNSTQTTDHSIALNNLTAGQTYYYKAKWTDEDGNTGTSEEKTFSTDPPPTVKDVSASNIGISSSIVDFTVKDASKVKIYYGETTSFGGVKEVSTSTLETSYTVKLSGLKDGTKYYYKINTFDTENEEYEGTILDFATLPRPEVSSVRIQQVRNTAQPAVLVSWQSNTEVSSIVTYYPEKDSASARDQVNVALVKGKHEMIIRGLKPETEYILIVKGRDKIGNEAQSDAQRFTTATDTRPPQISEVTVEGKAIPPSQTAGQTSQAQLVVSWNTDELSTSQVEFGEGTGTNYPQKTQLDSNMTYNHLVVISNLTPSKVYHLRALSQDEAGNLSQSVDTVTIAPKATDNALNLVITNLQEAFGFLKGVR
jgi:hypothetical protein